MGKKWTNKMQLHTNKSSSTRLSRRGILIDSGIFIDEGMDMHSNHSAN